MSVFEVAIGPGQGPGQFRVEVIESPAGRASAEVVLDVDQLPDRSRLEEVLLASAVGSRRVPTESERVVLEAGRTLFAALLGAGEVAGVYRASAAVAAERGEPLRLVLAIDAPELAVLPWEALYDGAGRGYVCRHNQLVRRVAVASVPPRLAASPPLQILGVISAPRGLAVLDADRERDQLERSLAGPAARGLAQITWAEAASWGALHELLLARRWHVLHFIGHGHFDPGKDEGLLALTREDGRVDWVEASRLADLLGQARPMPRLVMLNSCSGAVTGRDDLFSGTAAALARSGIAAVTAMQYSISDSAAIAFARGFYTALAHGRLVDEAVSAGRIAILGTSSNTLEWITPVLYLRGHDTRLLKPPPASTPARMPHPTARPTAKSLASDPARAPHQAAASRPADPPNVPPPFRLTRTLYGPARAVAFSPNGTLLATDNYRNTAVLWDTATAQTIHTLTGHTLAVSGVAFSPDGKQLATASDDHTARLCHTATGTPIYTLTGHRGAVHSVAFSPDGSLLATASGDHTARLWHTLIGTSARNLTGHDDAVFGVAFSPDGSLLATTSYDHTARLWDTATGEIVRTLADRTLGMRGVTFSPDGSLLATTSYDNMARLWDTATGTLIRTLEGHNSVVYGVAFSPDGALLATTSGDQTALLWACDQALSSSFGSTFAHRDTG